jgi:Ca-activated chloride channel family protein
MNGRKLLGYGMAAVLALVVIGIIMASIMGRSSGSTTAADAPADNTVSAAANDRTDCTPINIASSSEKASLLQAIADKYNATDPKVGDQCMVVRVQTVASGGGEQALAAGWDTAKNGPEPTVWTPASSLWLKLLETKQKEAGQASILADTNASLIKTPVVFAMPKPMAEALGWPKKAIGWKTLTELAADPQGWAKYGHPEWGQFTLGKTHPLYSTSGLAGTIGEYYAATGLTSDLKVVDVENPDTQKVVADTEQAVTHYGDTTLTFLNNQYEADKKSSIPYVSATVVEEKSVFDYNSGNPTGKQGNVGKPPRVPLAAVQPAEGTMYSDSPYAILNASWVTPEQKTAAADFLTYLGTADSLKMFTDAGFRTPDEQLGATLKADPNFTAAPPTTVFAPPSGEIIAAIQSSWKDLRKKARIMMVMDVSGSMDEDAGDGQSKLLKATAAVNKSLDEFNPEDEVGFAIFTTDLPSGQDGIYQVLVPVGPMSTNAALIRKALQLQPMNGTPLYNTVLLSQQEAIAAFDKDRINAVVVLTDGRNEFDGGISLDELLQQITVTNETRNKTVKVFTIGYGEGADMTTLQQISAATGAASYDATKPENIEKVLTSVMSNF